MRWGWILAVLAAVLLSLWALGLLPQEEPTSQLQVISPEELLAATPEMVVWENSSGRVALRKISSGEAWRSNPTSNQIVLVLQGRGEAAFPQGPVTMGSEELLIVFQGTGTEIRAREDLSLLVFSTPLPEAVFGSEAKPQAQGGLLPMRVVLAERFAQPLSVIEEGLEGSPVFESPTGSVWLLRLRGVWALGETPHEFTETLALYLVKGRMGLRTEGRERLVAPGQLLVLPAGIPAELRPEEEGVLLVSFQLHAASEGI